MLLRSIARVPTEGGRGRFAPGTLVPRCSVWDRQHSSQLAEDQAAVTPVELTAESEREPKARGAKAWVVLSGSC